MTGQPPLSKEQAQALAEHIRSVDGVDSLHPGRFGEVTMLFPGARVPGITFNRDGHVEVHIVADITGTSLEGDLNALAERVRGAVAESTDLPATIVIADAV
ncbi:hypothetical protein C3B44_01715 [Corynebacterium yudongzhengii]|uniref:Asp23/Gls24 family envelope stress response protein n=1 Tax=Corynebacterium yudongzhengii TaxID=2080740 RepID=A0A2U1T9T6_9CORY|nr:hypothetical protein [Corynebacterium yudongzhengii]AWB81213.1 hypothetical protein C3B44_01715 [Corynebacterium yudongzhengii]PWC02752.1 hypothetical protein DF222_00445 [Corynebacterium yudongzhengii]